MKKCDPSVLYIQKDRDLEIIKARLKKSKRGWTIVTIDDKNYVLYYNYGDGKSYPLGNTNDKPNQGRKVILVPVDETISQVKNIVEIALNKGKVSYVVMLADPKKIHIIYGTVV